MRHSGDQPRRPGRPRPDEEPEEDRPSSLFSGKRSGLIWALLLAVTFLWLWSPLGPDMTDRPAMSYTDFRSEVEAGNVAQVTVTGHEVKGELSRPVERTGPDGTTREYREFSTHVPAFGDEEIFSLLREQGVVVNVEPESDISWWIVLLNVLPFLLLIWLVWFFLTRMRGQGQNIFSMGSSPAKEYDHEDPGKTTFDDVAGQDGAKRELQEIIEFLREPDKFSRLGGEIPRGVLLVGPPGTGKTLMARAVAGEAEVPFFNMSGSDFMEMLVGVGASRIRDLFNKAKEKSPAIIFIDELDSIGRQRGAGLGGGHDEREQTLNQLLAEMDGFEPAAEVVVMAATNRPDILDPALLRPGRFDRQVTVGLPTRNSRREILELHAREKPMADDVDLDEVARGTPGFSGADLKNLLNEAALLAARQDKDAIEREDVDEARDKVMMGLEREGIVMDEEERMLLAYHEGGHAVLAAVLPHADPLHKVTIVPRGQAMGVTQQLPERDQYIYRREYIVDRLAVMMGGRAAEDLVMDTATSGAEQDLKQATKLARRMVLDWGMSERFKEVAFGGEQKQVFLGDEIAHGRDYSEDTARDVDKEVQRILADAYRRAAETLDEHREGLDRLAEGLLEEEELEAERVFELLGIEDPRKKRDDAKKDGGGPRSRKKDDGESDDDPGAVVEAEAGARTEAAASTDGAGEDEAETPEPEVSATEKEE